MNIDEQNALLKRAYICLEDEDWQKVEDLTEKLLNANPELAEAYLLKYLASRKVHKLADTIECLTPLKGDKILDRALKYADGELLKDITECIGQNGKFIIYTSAKEKISKQVDLETCERCLNIFKQLGDYKDSPALLKISIEKRDSILERTRYIQEQKEKLNNLSQRGVSKFTKLSTIGKIVAGAAGILVVGGLIWGINTLMNPILDVTEFSKKYVDAKFNANFVKDNVGKDFTIHGKVVGTTLLSRELVQEIMKGTDGITLDSSLYELTYVTSENTKFTPNEIPTLNNMYYVDSKDHFVDYGPPHHDGFNMKYIFLSPVTSGSSATNLHIGDEVTFKAKYLSSKLNLPDGQTKLPPKVNGTVEHYFLKTNLVDQKQHNLTIGKEGKFRLKNVYIYPKVSKFFGGKISGTGNGHFGSALNEYEDVLPEQVLAQLQGEWNCNSPYTGKGSVKIDGNEINGTIITNLKMYGKATDGEGTLNPPFKFEIGGQTFYISNISWYSDNWLRVYVYGKPMPNGHQGGIYAELIRTNKFPSPPTDNTNILANNTSSNSYNTTPIHMGAISGTSESSADKENNYTHSAKLTIDNNTSSCWSEGVSGLGIGEYLFYQFNGTYKVSGIRIWSGHQKNSELFYKNARPTRIRVEGSNGQSEVIRLNDTFGMQNIVLQNPMNTNSIKIVIEAANSGSKWQDTSISEIAFY